MESGKGDGRGTGSGCTGQEGSAAERPTEMNSLDPGLCNWRETTTWKVCTIIEYTLSPLRLIGISLSKPNTSKFKKRVVVCT